MSLVFMAMGIPVHNGPFINYDLGDSQISCGNTLKK